MTSDEARLKRCYRCGARPGFATWNICADGNKDRVICARCDISLNRLVMRWIGRPNAKAPSVLSGWAWWRDRLWVYGTFPLTLALVAGYVGWRLLTCAVDSWGDLRAGRVPAAVTVWGRR